MQSSAQAADQILDRPKPKVRIPSLDVIRGLAILGVLAVNADGFAAPQRGSLNPLTWPFPHEGATALSYWVMDAFFHEKFLTIFSMLFGVSVFLVGGELFDRAKGVVLARRLGVLLIFGLLHGFGIWWGDILSLYAATGFVMFFCRSLNAKVLLGLGGALYVGLACASAPAAALPFAPTAVKAEAYAKAEARLHPDPQALAERKAVVAKTIAQAKGSWAGAYEANTKAYRNLLSGDPSLVPQTLALMMIGLGLFKSGFLAGRSPPRLYGAALIIGGLSLGAAAWMSWRIHVQAAPVLGESAFNRLLSPLIALAYVSVLIFVLRTGLAKALSPLAAAGRMAFTNYIAQSLLMTSIFYGGRGGLMGEVDRPALWGIVAGVWVLQLVWSPIWLSRFEMGPLEWVWRCLTLGRRVPFLKSS